ncbi:hypothetical protein ACHAQH_008575 [Verticillium albo-atrum]
MLGAGAAYPLAAWVCNKYGRKPGVWIGQAFLLLGTGLQANATASVISRLFVSLSSGFMLSGPMLLAESLYSTQRGIVSSLYNYGWYGGSLIAAWTTFGTRNMDALAWRIPSALHAAFPILAMPGFLLVDEPPRWLVSVDRVDEARRNLAKAHAGGDKNSPLVAFEMAEIESTILAERAAQANSSWADLWSTPGNRHRLFISVSLSIFCQWVGNGVVSYYLAMVLSSGFIMLVSSVIITGLSGSFAGTGHNPTGLAVIPFLFVYFAGYDVVLIPLAVSYSIEIWPFELRAKGLFLSLLTSLLAASFNIFVNPIALDAIQWKYYFVSIAVLVFMLVSTVAEIFDGPSATVHTTAKDASREVSAHLEDVLAKEVAAEEERRQS